MSKVPTSEELASLFKDGALPREIGRRFGLKEDADIQLAEERCVELHNSGTIDLLTIINAGDMQDIEGFDFFTLSHFYVRVLPELNASPDKMMACVEELVTRGGEDLASNEPNAALREWLKRDPNRSRQVTLDALGGNALASRHLTFALEAMSAISEARKIALSCDGERRLSAITALSRIKDDDPASRAETLSVFAALLRSGADDTLRGNMLHAVTAILARDSEACSPNAIALVQQLVKDGGDLTLHQAAHMLWECRAALQPKIVVALLDALMQINHANKGTINILDLGLQALLKHGYKEVAVEFVTNLLSGSEDGIELANFDSFTATLLSGPREQLGHVVAKWLLLGEPRLCQGIADALRGEGLDGPPIDIGSEDLDIPPMKQTFLCRKAIGWFFLKPTSAASILVSVLRVCDEETAEEIQNLLVNPLLLNFSGFRKYLELLEPADPAKVSVDKALSRHEAYLKAIRVIPVIKELQPSEHHRRIEHLRLSDQMGGIYKQAKKQSIFLNFVKHSVLLYGNRSLSFIKSDNDELRPIEMDLQPHGVSYEMPRMEIVDPVGLDYIIRAFRVERMVE